jgi:hypothetical protein
MSLRTSFCFIISLFLACAACEDRKIKYSGMNDKFIGVEQVVLFENGDFYLEIDEYNTEGTYRIKGDTVLLNYNKRPSATWPGHLTMKEEYFLIDHPDSAVGFIKIMR